MSKWSRRILELVGLAPALNLYITIVVLVCTAGAGLYMTETVFSHYQQSQTDFMQEKGEYRAVVAEQNLAKLVQDYQIPLHQVAMAGASPSPAALRELLHQEKFSFVVQLDGQRRILQGQSQYLAPTKATAWVTQPKGPISYALPGSSASHQFREHLDTRYGATAGPLDDFSYQTSQVQVGCQLSALPMLQSPQSTHGFELLTPKDLRCLGLAPQGYGAPSGALVMVALEPLVKQGQGFLLNGLLLDNAYPLADYLKFNYAVSRLTLFAGETAVMTNLPLPTGQRALGRRLPPDVLARVYQRKELLTKFQVQLGETVYPMEVYIPLFRDGPALRGAQPVGILAVATGEALPPALAKLHQQLWTVAGSAVLLILVLRAPVTWLLARKELEIVQSREQLNALMQFVEDGICGLDHQGTILFANDAAHHLLGVKELNGQKVTGFLEVDQGAELLADLAHRHYEKNRPATFHCRDGQTLPCEYSTHALWGPGGLRHSLAFRDISHRQEMEAHRQQIAIIEERKRLAEDVHDGIMSYINATLMQIRSARTNLLADEVEGAYAQLMTAESHARTGLTEARRFNHLYQEQTWPWWEFSQRLQQIVDMAQAGGIAQTDLAIQGETQLAYSQGQDLLRIVEQAVHNALEHGQPQRLTVSVLVEPTQLVVRVTDDGRGFLPGTVQEGFGLASMQKRAERIGGTLQVTSQPQMGTTIAVTIPLGANP